LCKNGSFRWRIYVDLPTNFMNDENVSQIGRETRKIIQEIKKNVFFFVLHILYSHKLYRKTENKKKYPIFLNNYLLRTKKTFNCQPTEAKKSLKSRLEIKSGFESSKKITTIPILDERAREKKHDIKNHISCCFFSLSLSAP